MTRPVVGVVDIARSRTRTEPVPFLQQPGAGQVLAREWLERLRKDGGR